MNKFSNIFGQIIQILSRNALYRAVKETEAEKGAKGFTCWQKFVRMLFCYSLPTLSPASPPSR
jgi:hypothetical protein